MDFSCKPQTTLPGTCLQEAVVELAESWACPDDDFHNLGVELKFIRSMLNDPYLELAEERRALVAKALALLLHLLPAGSQPSLEVGEVIEVKPVCALLNPATKW